MSGLEALENGLAFPAIESLAEVAASLRLTSFNNVGGFAWKWETGTLEQVLTIMRRKLKSSGIERMMKQEYTHHIEKSETKIGTEEPGAHDHVAGPAHPPQEGQAIIISVAFIFCT